MAQMGRNQRFELGLQPVYLLRWQVEPEHFDGNEAFVFGVVGTEDRAKSSSPDLMQHTKWTEGVRGRGADSFRMQRGTPLTRRKAGES